MLCALFTLLFSDFLMFIQAYDLFLEQVRGLIVDRDGSHDWHKEGDELVNDDVEEAADKATVKKMPPC